MVWWNEINEGEWVFIYILFGLLVFFQNIRAATTLTKVLTCSENSFRYRLDGCDDDDGDDDDYIFRVELLHSATAPKQSSCVQLIYYYSHNFIYLALYSLLFWNCRILIRQICGKLLAMKLNDCRRRYIERRRKKRSLLFLSLSSPFFCSIIMFTISHKSLKRILETYIYSSTLFSEKFSHCIKIQKQICLLTENFQYKNF